MSHNVRVIGATKKVAGRMALLAVFLFSGDPRVWAQGSPPIISPSPFIHQDTLLLEDGAFAILRQGRRHLAIVDDTALVATTGIVSVYERNTTTGLWSHVADLSPGDGTENFVISFDGRRAILGAAGAAYVFRRQRNGAHEWRQVASLLPSDGAAGFGADVAIDGRYAFVGAPGDVQLNRDGSVFVFKRTADGWQEIAKLTPPAPTLRLLFGGRVAISGDTAIVSASSASPTPVGTAYIFGRDQGGTDNWGLVKDLGLALGGLGGPAVAIDGDTAVIGAGDIPFPSVRVFGRDEGGPNAWGLQAQYGGGTSGVCCGTVTSASISGDYVILGAFGLGNSIQIRARNQGGPNAWGLVSNFSGGATPAFQFAASVSIDGDTALLDADPAPDNDTVSVFVSDVDGDGMRDGVDPCVRDPLNNVDGGCQRSSAAHPILDDLIAQSNVTSETRGNRHFITATFTNTGTTAVKNPFFEVTELTGGNVLANADGGPGGVGATLSPDVGDGMLSPDESMRVTFRVRLQSREPFQIVVGFHGDPVQ